MNSLAWTMECMEYTGYTCNLKTYSKSYTLNNCVPSKPEDMFIIQDLQEAFVPQKQWERVQELRENRHRHTKAERLKLFSGLLFCADCSIKLYFATCKNFEGNQDHYVCSQYKSGRGDSSAHYIREDVLQEIVLVHIQAVNEYVRHDVEGFEEEWVKNEEEMDGNMDSFL